MQDVFCSVHWGEIVAMILLFEMEKEYVPKIK